jgi:hypothetical protein
MSNPNRADAHQDVRRAAKLLHKRGSNDLYRKIAVERKLKTMPEHVVRQARAHVESITMPEEHIFLLHEGITPELFIDKQINVMKEAVLTYWRNYDRGLNNLGRSMEFASKDETESHYLETALKAVAKADLDLFLDGLGDGCPELKAPIKVAKELITSELEEHERVEKAKAQMTISHFLQHMESQIGKLEASDVGHINALGKTVKEEYDKVAADSGGQGTVISGAGAVLLEQLEQAARRLQGAIETKSVDVLQEDITEVFAKTGDELVGPITAGLHENATLYLDCRAHFSGGKWELPAVDDAWILMTNAPEPERVVDSLRNSLKEQNDKSIVASHLRKVVKATLDIDSGHWYELDCYDDVIISFTDINHVEFETSDVTLHGNNPREAVDAWNEVIKPKVATIAEFHGKNG